MLKIKIICLLIVLSGFVFCQGVRTNYLIVVDDTAIFGQKKAQELLAAAAEWNMAYKSSRKIRIKYYASPDVKINKNGDVETTLEIAEPGMIKIGKEGNARNIILHAMTHASAPDTPTILPGPLEFKDGVIYGYHGLGILVELKFGARTKFNLFEEGMAERNAALFQGYTVSNRSYANVGSLTIRHFQLSAENNFVSRNDVPGFVAKYLGKNRSDICLKDILKTMDEYQDAWGKK